MKKTVKSRASLNMKALKSGATITSKSGLKFNAKAKQKDVVSQPAPKPVFESPKPSAEFVQSEKIGQAIHENTSAIRVVMDGLMKEMRRMQQAGPEPIRRWEFQMLRDKDGLIESISATAEDSLKVLN